ncbi:MAG: hypothetical protein LCH53_03675 [Bacteroidetes bacterium]|nr:hypothetical protein [Bacteroidota bacterium]
MLSIEACRSILEQGSVTYTRAEIEALRSFLHRLALIEYEQHISQQTAATGHPLHARLDGRSGRARVQPP